MSGHIRLSHHLACLLIAWCVPGLEMVDGQVTPSSDLSPEALECITYVISVDDSLGAVRNHASETLSLEKTIRNYANAMAAISFTDCPEQFTSAFEDHRQAWLAMIPFVEKYPEMRGEMHELFDDFENGPMAEDFAPLLKKIWDTWYEVENAVK